MYETKLKTPVSLKEDVENPIYPLYEFFSRILSLNKHKGKRKVEDDADMRIIVEFARSYVMGKDDSLISIPREAVEIYLSKHTDKDSLEALDGLHEIVKENNMNYISELMLFLDTPTKRLEKRFKRLIRKYGSCEVESKLELKKAL